MKVFRTFAVASLLLATAYSGVARSDVEEHSKSVHPISKCNQNIGDKSLFVVDGVMCVYGSIAKGSFEEKVAETDFEWVVVHSSGGEMSEFIELSLALRDKGATFLVPRACMSACAMILLPSMDKVYVGSGALITQHRYLFDNEDDYVEYAFQRRHHPIDDHDLSPLTREALGRRAFQSYQQKIERLREAYELFGVDQGLLEFFSVRPACYDEALGYHDWQYSTLLNLDTFASYRDTDNWTWSASAEMPKFERLRGPLCDSKGQLVYVPD